MDEAKAIKILTGELAKDLGISIVRDKRWQDELKEKSMHFYQHSNPFVAGHGFYSNMKHTNNEGDEIHTTGWRFINSKHTQDEFMGYDSLDKAIAAEENYKSANYFFIDQPVAYNIPNSSNGFYFFVTPYSIIGEKEILDIKKLFYKDIQPQIQGAMDILSIENYADVYPLYANNKSLDLTGTVVKEFLNSAPNLNYFNDRGNNNIKVVTGESIENVNLLNSEFENIGLKSRLDPTKYREKNAIKEYRGRINKMNIEEVINEIEQKSFLIAQEDTRKKMLKNFWDFVFTIPYKNQNIESNMNILKSHAGEIDYISILGEEYNKNRHFPEYFNCLDDLQQQRVARCLKTLPERNIANDSFLWSKGFKEISRNYMDLYKKDADEFIKYFQTKNQDDKKTILKDIMNCDYTNKAAADWLDENEIGLLREVSMDG